MGRRKTGKIVKCLVCSKKFYTHKGKFCSQKCDKEYRKGKPRPLEVRIKIREAQLGQHHSPKTEFKKGHKFSKETVEKIRKARIERGYESWIFNDEDILEEVKKLEEQGYKCIPIGLKKFPKPDIIAIKENKIEAFEIQRGEIRGKVVDKYKENKYFDKVNWIKILKGQ